MIIRPPNKTLFAPTGPITVNSYWLSRGLQRLYVLNEANWDIDQVSGQRLGTLVGTGHMLYNNYIRTSGVNDEYINLPISTSLITTDLSIVFVGGAAGNSASLAMLTALDRTSANLNGFRFTSNGQAYEYSANTQQAAPSLWGLPRFNTNYGHLCSQAISFSVNNYIAFSNGKKGSDTGCAVPTVGFYDFSLGATVTDTVTQESITNASLVAFFNGRLTDNELYQLSVDPWRLVNRNNRIFASAAVGNTVTPTTGHLSFTGYAPTIAQPQTVNPAKGTLTYIGHISTVQQPVTVNPAKGTLTYTGHAPTIEQPITVNPVMGHLSYTGYVPTVTIGNANTVNPTTGHLAFTGYIPAVLQPQTINPSTGHLTYTGYNPTVLQPQTVNPVMGHLSFTGYAPTVTTGDAITVNPTTGHLSFTGYAPTIEQPNTVNPVMGHLSFTGYAPTIITGGANTVSPTTGHLIYTGYDPVILQRAIVDWDKYRLIKKTKSDSYTQSFINGKNYRHAINIKSKSYHQSVRAQ